MIPKIHVPSVKFHIKKFFEVNYSNTRGTVMSRRVFGFDEPDLPTKIKVHNCLAMTHSQLELFSRTIEKDF